jgi:hypothetical protein
MRTSQARQYGLPFVAVSVLDMNHRDETMAMVGDRKNTQFKISSGEQLCFRWLNNALT